MSIGSTLLFAVVALFRFPPAKHLRQQGFTLLELMIVVAIIGTLSAIAIPKYLTYLTTARNAVTIATLRQIDRQASSFYINNDFDLYSMGADGKSQTPFTAKASQDDLVRVGQGAFFGRVSDY